MEEICTIYIIEKLNLSLALKSPKKNYTKKVTALLT